MKLVCIVDQQKNREMSLDEFCNSPEASTGFGKLALELLADQTWSCDYRLKIEIDDIGEICLEFFSEHITRGKVIIASAYKSGTPSHMALSVFDIAVMLTNELGATAQGLARAVQLVEKQRVAVQIAAEKIMRSFAKQLIRERLNVALEADYGLEAAGYFCFGAMAGKSVYLIDIDSLEKYGEKCELFVIEDADMLEARNFLKRDPDLEQSTFLAKKRIASPRIVEATTPA